MGSKARRERRVRVVGYVRVSTEEQADKGVSLAAQVEKLKLYCRLHELDLVAVEQDPGVSGKSLDRPGLTAALGRLDGGEADGLLIAKLDRLTRSVRDLGTLLESHFSESKGYVLMSVADQVDTRTAAGRLVLNVLISVAQWERETTVERTVEGLRFKREAGERTGGVPYGYDVDPAGPVNRKGRPSRLVPVAAEQRGLALIAACAVVGLSLRATAAKLDALGVPTKKGRPGWSAAAVARILGRPDLRDPSPATVRAFVEAASAGGLDYDEYMALACDLQEIARGVGRGDEITKAG